MPVVMRLRVVSLPAFCNSMKNRSICICVSVSPSTSAVISTLRRSSRGSARRCSQSPSAYMNIAVAASDRSSGVTVSSKPNVSSVQRKTCSRSSSGTPTRSAMTCSGSQSAMSVTRSHSSLAGERADDAVDAIADPILELGDPAGREALVDQLAQLRVQRRILADEQLGHRASPSSGISPSRNGIRRVAERVASRARRAGRRRGARSTQ